MGTSCHITLRYVVIRYVTLRFDLWEITENEIENESVFFVFSTTTTTATA
eukprot:CAMPEP_0170960742 /NCGR_PEP_ID=MMETSP0735-20130129/37472_1 /TAXON_ID=186038 /ORGANISM="Fragilariopsis kerguelensis, Strain L26-C5" /LENGTH=49 /DNA_ID= /DNA_START= /DNA_END= /DNA_ORIENTATION=